MVTRRINLGFLVCFLIAAFVGQSLSQTRGYSRTRERYGRSRLRNMTQKQRQPAKNEDESMKQALRATEEHWKAIKPKLNKVRKLKSRADVSIRLMCVGVGGASMGGSGSSVAVKKGFGRMSGSGYGSSSDRGTTMPIKDTNGKVTGSPIYYGWQWLRPSQQKGLENLNEGEKICEELFGLLEDRNSELEEIRQKMEALRKFRQEAKKELAIAQKELRQLVTPRQEAALIMMGLLD